MNERDLVINELLISIIKRDYDFLLRVVKARNISLLEYIEEIIENERSRVLTIISRILLERGIDIPEVFKGI